MYPSRLVCRICLDQNVASDWNKALIEHSNLTYKDCYYKYTRLKQLDDDSFSSMLCKSCLSGLEDVHSLIVKALESYNFLVAGNCVQVKKDNDNYVSTDIKAAQLESPVIQQQLEHQSFNEFPIKSEGELIICEDEIGYRENLEIEVSRNQCIQTFKEDFPKNILEEYEKHHGKDHKHTDDSQSIKQQIEYNNRTKNIDESKRNTTKENSSKSKRNITIMCSYCPKTFRGKWALRSHEDTHLDNPERKEACEVCGQKFYTKKTLKIHMLRHKENREKIHKCEFCDKAFFTKASLNNHRQRHLGVTIPCSVCTKEFCRQTDLNRHMETHAAVKNGSDTQEEYEENHGTDHKQEDVDFNNENSLNTRYKNVSQYLNEPSEKSDVEGLCNYINIEERQHEDILEEYEESDETQHEYAYELRMAYETKRQNSEIISSEKSLEKDADLNTRNKLEEKEILSTRHKNDSQNSESKIDTNDNRKNNYKPKRNTRDKNPSKGIPRMCSFCSKIMANSYVLAFHEETHMNNRERKETCNVCGLKFFNKKTLYTHKLIHKENREKIHKCEFCDKAFYDKGALNVHRRIHLGQMVPCTLCPKEFYRQIDLDRHMSSHSAARINAKSESDAKKISHYLLRCKYCGKSIHSSSIKSHTAAHLNEPLMKCSICSKEYFRRNSCIKHIKRVHKKTKEEVNKIMVIYRKDRMTRLKLEQEGEIQRIYYIDQ